MRCILPSCALTLVGKLCLLNAAFRALRGASVATIYCSAQTTPEDVVQKLNMSCMGLNTHSGRTLRPKEGDNLILFLKDINLVQPDKWGTSALVTFLQQLLTYRGFYDNNLEWVCLEGVQVVASMNPSTTLGRSELSPRFTSLVRVLCVEYPDRAQLQEVYTALLQPVMAHKAAGRKDDWTSAKSVSRLATTMVGLYEQMRARFTPDESKHYRFSPKSLTRWVVGLLRYNLTEVLICCPST